MIQKEKAALAVTAKIGAANMPSVCCGVEITAPNLLADAILQMPHFFFMVIVARDMMSSHPYKDANGKRRHVCLESNDEPQVVNDGVPGTLYHLANGNIGTADKKPVNPAAFASHHSEICIDR